MAEQARRHRSTSISDGGELAAYDGDVDHAGRIVVTLWQPKTVGEWLEHLILRRGYPRATRDLIRTDAEDLLNRMSGGEAYAVAEKFCHANPPIIDASRPSRHWFHVSRAIADHLGIDVGLPGYQKV